jgi:DNA-binding transcriptional LysR family regulator
MNNLDNLSALKVFTRAAETRSFTEAGNQLGLSSSAVGKAIARLEQRLGVRLFHRSTRSIQLTDEGQQFLDSCRRIFAELDAIEAGLAETKSRPRGRLRVSLPRVGMLMMPTLAAFMRSYPEIELDLHFSDNLVDIVNDGFDVVIRTGDATDSRLIARSLGNYHLQLVGSAAYFQRGGSSGDSARPRRRARVVGGTASRRSNRKLEDLHRLGQGHGLPSQALGSRCGFLDERRVLLGDLVQLRDGATHLLDAGRLLPGRRTDLCDEAGYLPHLSHDIAHRRACLAHKT